MAPLVKPQSDDEPLLLDWLQVWAMLNQTVHVSGITLDVTRRPKNSVPQETRRGAIVSNYILLLLTFDYFLINIEAMQFYGNRGQEIYLQEFAKH